MFSVGAEILDKITAKKGIVVGTKDEPYKPKIDHLNRSVIPFRIGVMDYQIMLLCDDGNYKGIEERRESDLDSLS